MKNSPNLDVGNATPTKLASASSRRQYLGLAIIFGIGLLVSVQLFLTAKQYEHERINSQFLEAAKDRVTLLQQEINASLYEVESLGAFYSASDNISRVQFRAFVQPFLAHNPAIQALEWIPRVTDAQRPQHEFNAQQDGIATYQITQRQAQGAMVRADTRDEYFPVFYVEPFASNEAAVGFNLASSATRLVTLKQARETGLMLATARITLVQEEEKQQGFLVFLPVYKKEAAAGAAMTLQGFALGVFRIGDILTNAVSYLDPLGINISLFDDSAPIEKSFLAHYPSQGSNNSEDSTLLSQQPMQYSESFEVAGRQWRVISTPTQKYLASGRSFGPWLALTVSLLLTLSLSGYLYLNLKRVRQGQEYTRRLLHSKESLQLEVEVRIQAEQELKHSNSELETAHVQLKSQQQQLVHSEKLASVGQLAAGVAHEINNPTGYVMGNLEVLKEYKHSIQEIFKAYGAMEKEIQNSENQSMNLALKQVDDLKANHDLDYILTDMDELLNDSINGTVRIQKIVQDLKSFSRVNDSDKKSVDLNEEVIETALRLVWNELKYKCTLQKELKDLPKFSCFPGELSQVIMNLLTNASDAIEEKGEISIFSESLDSHILIRICDDGCGISEADMLKLFDPFFTTKEVGKGTGLGLSISQGIVKKHGGTLTVTSKIGEGTCFTILLPMTDTSDEANAD